MATNIIAVHGTFAGKKTPLVDNEGEPILRWWDSKSEFAEKLRSSLGSDNIRWRDVQWTGNNLESDRVSGAIKLHETWSSLDDSDSSKNIILAHSHGGNVVFNWLSQFENNDLSNTQIFTFGTPYVHIKKPSALRFLVAIIWWFLITITVATLVSGIIADLFRKYSKQAYENSNAFGQERFFIPSLIIIGICALVFLLRRWWKNLRAWRFRVSKKQLQAKIEIITHNEDEAVAALKNRPGLKVQATSFLVSTFFFAFPLLWGGGYLLNKSLIEGSNGYGPLLNFGWDLFMGGWIAVGIFMPLVIFTSFASPIVDKLTSKRLNKKLHKLALGDNKGSIKTMKRIPQLRTLENNIVDHRALGDSEYAALMKSIKENADFQLTSKKSMLLTTLMSQNGEIFAAIKANSEIANSLIHCNYFTDDMARYISSAIKVKN